MGSPHLLSWMFVSVQLCSCHFPVHQEGTRKVGYDAPLQNILDLKTRKVQLIEKIWQKSATDKVVIYFSILMHTH